MNFDIYSTAFVDDRRNRVTRVQRRLILWWTEIWL